MSSSADDEKDSSSKKPKGSILPRLIPLLSPPRRTPSLSSPVSHLPLLCACADSDFQQQRLKAWQPLLTPLYIILTFLSVGVLFCIIGAVVLSTTSKVTEKAVRYDNLPLTPSNSSASSSSSSSACDPSTATSSPSASCFSLTIPTDMSPPIYVYYRLTNFYQNHRRYVKSRSDGQLQGMSSPPFTTCEPLASNGDQSYYPCGLIAASTFNDTINATLCTSSSSSSPSSCTDLSTATFSDLSNPSWKKTGIAWPSDVQHKFKRVVPSYPYTNISWDGRVLPDVEDEDFIVWMRTSGLPSFKKLYRQITDRTLPAGSTLVFSVDYQFPTAQYGGEKWVVVSTTSWMGGKNDFLGWTYVAVGIACVLVAAVFGVKQLVRPRKLGEIGPASGAGTRRRGGAERGGAKGARDGGETKSKGGGGGL